VVFSVIRATDATKDEYPDYKLPFLYPIPISLLKYGGYKFASQARNASKDGVVVLYYTEPDQFSRFFERLQKNKFHAVRFDDIEQFLDSFAIATDWQDKDFQDKVIRTLYTSIDTTDDLIPFKIRDDEYASQAARMLSSIFEHKDWKGDAVKYPWVNLFISGIARAMAGAVEVHSLDMHAYRCMIAALGNKLWKGTFCELLVHGIEALYKHNTDYLCIELLPIESFLMPKI
jgi:hypothetical protein